ncbi:calmodulin-1 isoform X1 [Pezoporus occidentalis]|uniref:calmodulin-1 isoform X1 n=1 Tax=Pezoporus occidentalis TaxID=407982 RepID=UPI002F90D744
MNCGLSSSAASFPRGLRPCGRPGPAPSRRGPASLFPACGAGSPPERAGLFPPGAVAPQACRALFGAGALPGGAAGKDPARLRHQLHCGGSGGVARGRAPRCSYCALGPHPPKNAAAVFALHHVSSSSSPVPAHSSAGGTGAHCTLLGWKRPSVRSGVSAWGAQPPFSLGGGGGLRRKSCCLSRCGEGMEKGKAGCGAQAPLLLKDEDVLWRAAGEGGEVGTHCSSGWLRPLAGNGACCVRGLRATRCPARRRQPPQLIS